MSVRTYTPDEILRAIMRRRWAVLVPLALGVAVTPLLARLVPKQYRSETLILVLPQRVPENYVKATVTESVEDRLPAITEQILSRSRLERIIQEMDLYKADRAVQVMEDVVAKMRYDVNVSFAGGARREQANSFRVSYVSENAEVARKVTERLATLYIEQNINDRATQADSTSQFLATQLEEAKRRLLEQERKLEDYKKRNSGQLPTQMQGNLQVIQNANLQLQSLNESTNRALERRLLVERQIADAELSPLPAGQGSSAILAATPTQAATGQLLEAARARLVVYLQRYTPGHPEVVSLERTIAELTAQLEQETPLGATPATGDAALSPAEAAQKKRVLDLKAELAVVDHQLSVNRNEERQLKAQIVAFQANVDATPRRESELVELTRDYSTLQTAYSNLLMKREDSMIAANLERRQIGEQFKILDPASRPERPYNQNRRLPVLALGAGAGFVLGLLLVGLLEVRDSSFRREEEVHAVLSLPVLALIPLMSSDRERRAARIKAWALDVGTAALLVVAVVGAVAGI